MRVNGPVSEVFEKSIGPVRLDPSGKWWATRDLIGLGLDGEITVLFGDGEHVASLTGTPDVLRRVAATIVAQVESAIVN